MLREIENTRQVSGEPRRRWFADDIFDLIVWYSPSGEKSGFQLCYRDAFEERALTWMKDKGFSHNKIDDGEGISVRYKMTPILVPDGAFDRDHILELFEAAGQEIDVDVTGYVQEKIIQYPILNKQVKSGDGKDESQNHGG